MSQTEDGAHVQFSGTSKRKKKNKLPKSARNGGYEPVPIDSSSDDDYMANQQAVLPERVDHADSDDEMIIKSGKETTEDELGEEV